MNVADEFSRAAVYYPGKKALIFGNSAFTYAEMHQIIERLAGYLIHLGIQKGDRVSLYMPNRPEWILFYYAIARIGAIAVCVPGAYKRDEMKSVVADSLSTLLVTSEELRSQLPASDAIPSVRQTIIVECDEVFQSI
jgi:acyl-coenzyme A synthetase/AMP-(fatty) acid ligase